MPDLEGGQFQSSSTRNAPPRTPMPGVRESLGVYDLAVPPPVSRGAAQAEQLARALGIGLHAIDRTVNLLAGMKAEERRKFEAIERGTASRDWRTDLALWEDRITQRKLLVPDGVPVRDYASQLIEQKVEGRSDAYAEAYRQAAPYLTESFLKQQQGIQEEVRNQIIGTTRDSIAVAQTPDQIQREAGQITADDANSIIGLMHKKEGIDVEAKIVEGLRGAGKVIPPNLTGGFMRYLARRDIIDAALGSDGHMTYTGIRNPELAADEFAAAGFVLPQTMEQIAHAFSTAQTMDHMQLEARTYAAIATANPLLAEGIRQEMAPAGKARADAIMAQLTAAGRPETLAVGPTGAPDANPAFAARVQEVLGDKRLMEVKTVELTGEQAQAILWNEGHPLADTAGLSAVALEEIEEKLPEGLNNNFRFGFGRDVAVGLTAVNEYQSLAQQELRVALTLQPNEAKAAERAKRIAVLAILNKRPPILWNSVVRVGQEAPYAFDDAMGDEMLSDIAAAVKEGRLTQDADFYEDNYSPAWLPDRRVSGEERPGAWTLIDAAGLPLTIGGHEFLWRPKVETFEQFSDRIEREGRRKQEAWQKAMETYNDQIMFPP